MKTKLTGAFVIGYDGHDHVIYRDGEVVYEDDRIEFVGHDYATAGGSGNRCRIGHHQPWFY